MKKAWPDIVDVGDRVIADFLRSGLRQVILRDERGGDFSWLPNEVVAYVINKVSKMPSSEGIECIRGGNMMLIIRRTNV
jgi:hypothetical protein